NSRARGSASVAFSEQVRKRCVVDGLVVRRRLRRELTPALDTRGTPHDAHLAAGPDVEQDAAAWLPAHPLSRGGARIAGLDLDVLDLLAGLRIDQEHRV